MLNEENQPSNLIIFPTKYSLTTAHTANRRNKKNETILLHQGNRPGRILQLIPAEPTRTLPAASVTLIDNCLLHLDFVFLSVWVLNLNVSITMKAGTFHSTNLSELTECSSEKAAG